MSKLQKMNHVTHLTNNLPATIEFYTQVLGMKLVAAERRAVRRSDLEHPPTVERENIAENAFGEQITVLFEMLNGSRISFVEVVGLSSWPANPLPRWIKHMAMRVSSELDLQRAKAALESKGISVLGITDHGLFRSIYFFDPVNDIRLEYACNVTELDEEDSRLAWAALDTWVKGNVPANKSIH